MKVKVGFPDHSVISVSELWLDWQVCVWRPGARQLPRMLQALTTVARLSFSMTLLSHPSSPLSARLPTRHPSDGLLLRYRKSSSAAAARLAVAESTSTETDWSSPARTATRTCTTDDRRPHDLQLSPPRERSRSDATAYYRHHHGRVDWTERRHHHGRRDHDRLIDVMMCDRGRRSNHGDVDNADATHKLPHWRPPCDSYSTLGLGLSSMDYCNSLLYELNSKLTQEAPFPP